MKTLVATRVAYLDGSSPMDFNVCTQFLGRRGIPVYLPLLLSGDTQVGTANFYRDAENKALWMSMTWNPKSTLYPRAEELYARGAQLYADTWFQTVSAIPGAKVVRQVSIEKVLLTTLLPVGVYLPEIFSW